MAVLIVTYDLKKPGQDYTDLLARIKEHSWARLSESSYAIRTSSTPEAVLKYLSEVLDAGDQIFVITLRRPYYGRGPHAVHEWLDENLS